MEDKFEAFLLKDELPEFTLAEVMELERSFKKMGKGSLDQEFCEELATKFSCSLHRSEKSSITDEQVHRWFQDRQKQAEAKSVASASILKDLVGRSAMTPLLVEHSSGPSRKRATYITQDIPQKSRAKQTPGLSMPGDHAKVPLQYNFCSSDESVVELTELMYEARSAKDFAWFDVAAFLNYRVVSTGELEVRVRFAGFGNEEDEWVNVRRAVRKRSIPLEDSECQKVDVGDLVLCYREAADHALYCDAHIVQIERRLHDIMGCRCIFVVRYDHDYVEDKVQLHSLCCRPT